MKEQPGFEGFNFNFDDLFKGFGGDFGHRHGSHGHKSGGGGFKFSFDDIFSQNNGDDDDEDSPFSAGHHGFGGFGFGDDMFSSFGSHESTFVRQEARSSGIFLQLSLLPL